MARKFSMSTLRQRCLQRVDMGNDGSSTPTGNDGSVSPSELSSLLSEQYGELCGEVTGTGDRYYETSTTITATGTNTITDPTDILSVVDTIERIYDTSTGKVHRLKRISAQERSYWKGRTGANAKAWELVQDTIYLYPTPPSGDQYILRYIPQPPDLTTYLDSDQVDVINAAGEAFLIWGVAVKLLAKSRSDVTLAITEREAARDRLLRWAADRLINEPHQAQVEIEDDFWPPRDGSWYYDR